MAEQAWPGTGVDARIHLSRDAPALRCIPESTLVFGGRSPNPPGPHLTAVTAAIAASTVMLAATANAATALAAGPKLNSNGLSAVAAVPGGTAWAVGGYDPKREASQNGPAALNLLNGVAALSRPGAVAIGYYGNGVTSQSLAERWNGRAWKRVSSPSPGGIFGTTLLNGIAAASATSAWAVGYYARTVPRTLILHWNGRAWKRVPSPNR